MGSGGSFVAILLSVPLTAVALVGVIGVPKLQEMLSTASSAGDEEFDPESFGPSSRSRRGSGKGGRDNEGDAAPWGDDSEIENDLVDDFGSKPRSSRPKASLTRGGKAKSNPEGFQSDLDPEGDDFFKEPPRARSGSKPEEPESSAMLATDPFKQRSPVTQAEHRTPAAAAQPADGFAAGIEKLRGMGVDRFHLEPGLGAGQFLFVCQVESAGEKGTVHRFEAEAGDPAAAVADVTRQLAAWQAESSIIKTAGAEFRR